jgi:hypothetical protein
MCQRNKASCPDATNRMNLSILAVPYNRGSRTRSGGLNLIRKTTVAGPLVQERQNSGGISGL